MPIQKINANFIKNLFDYVVDDQHSFNELFEQTSAGNYKYRDGIKNIYFNSGVYSIPLMLDYNEDAETTITFDANTVTKVLYEDDVVFSYTGITGTLPDLPSFIPSSLTDLSDFDGSYVDNANSFVVVNGTEDGLTFLSAGFTDLKDTPVTLTDQAGKTIVVKDDETGLEFVNSEAQEYIVTATSDDQTEFTIPAAITNGNLMMLFVQATYQARDTYTVDTVGNTLTLQTGVSSGTKLAIIYGANIDLNIFNDSITANIEEVFIAGTDGVDQGGGMWNTFTMEHSPPSAASVMVFIDTTYQRQSTYQIVGNVLELDEDVPADTLIVVIISMASTTVTPADGSVTDLKLDASILALNDIPNSYGNAGEVLKVNSGANGFEFIDPSLKNIVTKTNDYTIETSDDIILCDGSSNTVTSTLPTAVGNTGQIFIIKAIDIVNTVDVITNGAETIDGSASHTFSNQYEKITVVSDGSNWFII